MRNYGQAKFKSEQRVKQAAPGTLNTMQRLYGISLDDFLKAVYGDKEAIRKLADLGRLSEAAQTNLEPALKAAKSTIETTGRLDKALAELVKQTQVSGKQSMQALYDSSYSEQKLNNELLELQNKQTNKLTAENTRHTQRQALLQIEGTTAYYRHLVFMAGRIVKVSNETLPPVIYWWQAPDVLGMLLAEKRSESTRRAYDRDIKHFFATMFGVDGSAEYVVRFLALSQGAAFESVVRYKGAMIQQGLAEATVNRRLSALRALTHKGRLLGVCNYTLEDIKGETVVKYRDTSGITPTEFKQILYTCDPTTAKGVRDYAILRLLWDNALRRGEVAKLTMGDFDRRSSKLLVLGKGRGSQKLALDLTPKTRCSDLKS